ncbi:pilus assembly protein TadG-related protein [Sphingobium bisphenolivorans]|uniref:pilus assembly protein TadG-related protein n=1 Tax=Sphingobium bisphenolivorans TaxID=1335760 RepID=UPI00039EE5A0|nr:pilus assembly protein TadG-related protein [Sphingobium bisphenolivorans]
MFARRKSLLRSTSGAVAPTVALSLFGLIAAGGIAFDYSRLASMDSELQSAADQAALAAATQLDGSATSITRATSAAQALIANRTLFANDGNSAGRSVTIPNLIFYSSYNQDTDVGTTTTSPAAAKFVQVSVGPREAFYTLTPVVQMFRSGQINASAVAGLGEAICKVPPVMICNPQETGSNSTFDISTLVGRGLKLVSVGSGNGGWAPGNFGYLNTGGGSNGAPGLREALGWTAPPGDCVEATGVDTKPGATVSVTDALNTRFDIYDSNVSCPTGGNCPASINSIKDVVRPANASGNNACAIHNQGWQEVASSGRYLPSSATSPLSSTMTPLAMGHPRDMCHAVDSSTTGYCSGPIGNGAWDRDAYFRANYGWSSTDWPTNTGLSAAVLPTASNYASRYHVYAWEIAHRGQNIGGRTILGSRVASGSGANALTDYDAPVCSSSEGYGAGIIPGGTAVDRRRISVAVVNCTANNVHGNSTNVPVQEWMDVFLVEPSLSRSRTSAGDVYVEPIELTSAGANGQTQAQVIQRAVPYLLR